MATKTATEMATKMAVDSTTLSYEHFTLYGIGRAPWLNFRIGGTTGKAAGVSIRVCGTFPMDYSSFMKIGRIGHIAAWPVGHTPRTCPLPPSF